MAAPIVILLWPAVWLHDMKDFVIYNAALLYTSVSTHRGGSLLAVPGSQFAVPHLPSFRQMLWERCQRESTWDIPTKGVPQA